MKYFQNVDLRNRESKVWILALVFMGPGEGLNHNLFESSFSHLYYIDNT